MEFKEIQDLLKLINKSTLTDVEIERNDFKMRVQRRLPENVTYNMVQPGQQLMQPVTPVAPVAAHPQAPATPQVAAPQGESAAKEAAPAEDANSNLVQFHSPIIGTFYRSSGPDKDPYVKVGDVVSKGQVLCIIEAMKLFNEIEAEIDGKIVKILAENAQPVEYDQPLFLIEPA